MCKGKKNNRKGKRVRTERCAKLLFGDEIVTYIATIMEKKEDGGKRKVHKNSESGRE